MKKFLKSKNWLIIFIIVFAIFAASAGFFIFKFNSDIDIVRAGVGDNVSGFAWNSNIGWISFNSTDCDTDNNGFIDTDAMVLGCGGDNATDTVFDYGVNIDPTTGNFSGYAWSNNIGWISFAESETPPDIFAFSANCDNSTTCDDIGDACTACFNSTDDNVYGWAKILSLGDDGWIRMGDPTVGDTTFPIIFPIPLPLIFGSFAYSVSIDAITGDFSGWAWNANDNGTGIGWINFNCEDEGVCAASDYKVSLSSLEQPVITSVDPVLGYQCEKLKVNWGDISGETGYRVYGDDFSPPTTQVSVDLFSDTISFTDSGLLPDTTYYYIVEAFNGVESSYSDVGSGKTFAVCEVSSVVAEGVCPDTIDLSWLADVNADHYEVERCNETDLECTKGIFSVFSSGDDCFEPISNSCTDDTILNPGEIEDYFQYRIRAVSAGGEKGDWSALSNKEFACLNMPIWKEVK